MSRGNFQEECVVEFSWQESTRGEAQDINDIRTKYGSAKVSPNHAARVLH